MDEYAEWCVQHGGIGIVQEELNWSTDGEDYSYPVAEKDELAAKRLLRNKHRRTTNVLGSLLDRDRSRKLLATQDGPRGTMFKQLLPDFPEADVIMDSQVDFQQYTVRKPVAVEQ